ncbi:MAG: hypothetical protein HY900_32190 [Deltaproteobacteria bacterium]|nr:hypothetical protein [Deltaproteobacteria bacterium]
MAEWPTETGPVDYALFVGLDLLAVVEAKKRDRGVVSDVGQAKRYATGVLPSAECRFPGGPWGEYRVPFLFSSNGRPYLTGAENRSADYADFADGITKETPKNRSLPFVPESKEVPQ